MPTYTYTCTACSETIEKRQSFSDAPLTTCEQCGGALRKVIHPVGIVFKGSGWYITDSRSSSSSSSSSNGSTSTSASDGSTASKESAGSAKDASSTASKDSKDSSTSTSSSTASTSSKTD
ncbi:MAG: FmdB family transcriptional regulator [Chloroflexi bacterium]|nr:FmdB family transcriptional regulator [Chloroflexota bacterium]MBV9600605.1 FmdB family transcriptional regulator [Chloroflexota bacterium]